MKFCLVIITALAIFMWPLHAAKNPSIIETEAGPELVLTTDLKMFLNKEFPNHRVPSDKDFNPQMLKYFYSNLVGLHPAIAWGDFNNDKKRDYILLLVTGETPWGPLVELIILNGKKKGDEFDIVNREELYKFKDDYVSFREGKLYKGRYQQNGWYIQWDPKEKSYSIIKT